MGKTIAEKIVSAHCNRDSVAGDIIAASIDLAMATDGSGPLAIKLFGDMNFTAVWDPDRVLMEFMELKDHPYFVGTQAHPEFKSRPMRPSPLFNGLIKAALKK